MGKMYRDEVVKRVTEHGFPAEDAADWREQYRRHTATARRRGLIETDFSEYLSKAKEAGLKSPDDIGTAKDKFHLGRVGDTGDYRGSDCRFITSSQNMKEMHQNGRAIEGNKRRAEQMTGQTKETSERVRKISEALTGRTKENNPGTAAQADKLAKEFVLTAPDGAVHRGKNVQEFCDANDLNVFGVYNVIAGRRPHYKGWTGQYVAPQNEK
jgi:hypothetical protein